MLLTRPARPARRAGRNLLQLPGPTNVPDAVRLALAEPTLDHRGEQFQVLARGVLADVAPLFGTTRPVALFPGSGSGGWEAALVNTCRPGDRVVVYETGHFAAGWAALAARLGLDVQVVAGEWGEPVRADALREVLVADRVGRIRAVLVVHNETSTGVTSDVAPVRAALDAAGHGALLMVDAVSSLGAMAVEHDAWGADVTVTASQKGLMLPPGLVLVAVSARAEAARASAGLSCGYWDFAPMLAAAGTGSFPYTPASNMIAALRASLDLIAAEGLDAVFSRHRRLAAATRAAVTAWGLDLLCSDPAAQSSSVTAVLLPAGADEAAIKAELLDRFGVTVGGGLGRLAGRCLRIGHLGDVDEMMVISTLAALEMVLTGRGVARSGGVASAMAVLGGQGATAQPVGAQH